MKTARTGKAHIESLRDGRDVSIEGAHVADVTTHPAFRNAVRSAARLYDFQAAPAHLEAMTFASPDSGLRVSRCWQLPRSYVELVERRRALEAWAGLHYGFMGRSPDHVASCIAGMYMGLDLFEAYDRKRAGRSPRLLPVRPRQRSLPHLRHHQSAGRPLEGGARPGRPVPRRRGGR